MDERVRVLALSRNFGHQIAITAGLQNAVGDAAVVIDADLQDPPDVILEMLEHWREGVDVAYGLRTEREGETAFKRWTASAFYRLINRIADVAIPVDTGDFRLMDRKVVNAFLAMPERDRFVRGMVAWTGFRQAPVPYRRAARAAGETKYPLKKMLRFAIDGILSLALPLRLATYGGFCASGLALLGIACALGLRIFYRHLDHRLALAVHRYRIFWRRATRVHRHYGRILGAHLRRGEKTAALLNRGATGLCIRR